MKINYEAIYARINAWEKLPPEMRQARTLLNEKFAQAFAWLEAYVEQLNARISRQDPEYYNVTPLSVQDLVRYALSHKDDRWADYIVRGPAFEGFVPEPMMYEKLSIVTGVDFSDKPLFFSCSC